LFTKKGGTMKIAGFLLSIVLCFSLQLNAIDDLETMTTLEGEFDGSWFGHKVISMDFNGDGYDDLIVHSPNWNPSGVYTNRQFWGKIYFFWGGPNMNNEPDFAIEGSQNWEHYTVNMINAGDINGDGIDDLAITLPIDYRTSEISVYYGTANPTGISDLTITIPFDVNSMIYAEPLGDINGDGHADLVIHTCPWKSYTNRLIIWTGNDVPLVTLAETCNGTVATAAIGLGDVNGDGIDDYFLQYGIPGGTNMDSRVVLYYGDTNFPTVDSLVIAENTNAITNRSASPLGDLNNDGYADFEFMAKVWLGGPEMTPDHDLELTYHCLYHEWYSPVYNVGTPFVYGDLNGDGYDDIIGSTHKIHYYEGEAGIWVGGPNMDGLIDLYLYPPSDYGTRNFGWSKAAGDFNGDGLCDLAVSAPRWGTGGTHNWNTPGKVFVYSGNAALTDPAIAIDDQVEAEPSWELNVYPNPLRANDQINIDILGSGYKASDPLRLELFNVRGQKVFSTEYAGGTFNGRPLSIPMPEGASGLHILRIVQNKITVISKKICILE
jgi:hypothetical protein